MRREEGLEGRRLAGARIEKLLEKRGQTFGIDSRARRIDHAFRVGLGFIALAVVRRLGVGADSNRHSTANRSARDRQRAKQHYAGISLFGLLYLFHRVTSHHVSDFVAHDARQLVEAIRLLDRSAIHIDETSGKRERIHLR